MEAKCSYSVLARLKAAASFDIKKQGCTGCYRCLKALDFKCTETYRLRVQARSSGGFKDSAWSADLLFQAECSPEAAACYV
jgi:hypothetical protein